MKLAHAERDHLLGDQGGRAGGCTKTCVLARTLPLRSTTAGHVVMPPEQWHPSDPSVTARHSVWMRWKPGSRSPTDRHIRTVQQPTWLAKPVLFRQPTKTSCARWGLSGTTGHSPLASRLLARSATARAGPSGKQHRASRPRTRSRAASPLDPRRRAAAYGRGLSAQLAVQQ